MVTTESQRIAQAVRRLKYTLNQVQNVAPVISISLLRLAIEEAQQILDGHLDLYGDEQDGKV